MAHRSKIDWCDYGYNPITGCRHGCDYCYARRLMQRFSGDVRLNMADERCIRVGNGLYELNERFGKNPYPFGFEPTLHRYLLGEGSRMAGVKQPSNFFVGSMADLFGEWVPDEWISSIMRTCEQYQHHRYLFLTKNPERYVRLAGKGALPTRSNFWYGSTATSPDKPFFFSGIHKTFISVEPMLERFGFSKMTPDTHPDWVIVGAMTGKGAEKHQPKREWVEELAAECSRLGIPLFMKESLREMMGDDFIQQFPEELEPVTERRWGTCELCGKYHPVSKLNMVIIREQTRGSERSVMCVCDACLEAESEKDHVAESAMVALQKKHNAPCLKCGVVYRKKDMTAVMYQKEKGKRILFGYICSDCKEKEKRRFREND